MNGTPAAGDADGVPPARTAAAEQRPRRGPVVVAVLVALLPAIGFGALWQWAAAVDAEPVESVPETFRPAGPPAEELTTVLTSLRRVPGPEARRLASEADRAAFDELVVELAAVGETSCAALGNGEGIVAIAADDAVVIPASNQKLFVAVAALETIATDATLPTEVRAGPPSDGVLSGDLHLVGGGDPFLRSADVPARREPEVVTPTSFEVLADAVVDAGITRVEGDIVADGSRYDDEFVVPSWGPDITRADGGPVGALVVNDGQIVGSGVGLNPAQSAASELNRLLAARGVTVTGINRVGVAPDGLEVVGRVESAPVGDLVEEMLVTSDNQVAEMLLKEVGAVAAGEGSRPAGMAEVRTLLTERGVDLADARLEDGSGLSRDNAVRCATLLGLLASEPPGGPLYDRLPVVGGTGTLAEVGVGSPADDVVRAKTGTLTGVKALSGYLGPEAAAPDFPDRFVVLLSGDGVDDPDVHLPVWEAVFELVDAEPSEPRIDLFAPR